MPTFDPADLEPAESKRIVQSSVTPRPIAWISTVGADGVDNLAPFSSYNYFATGGRGEPAIVHFNSPTAGGEMKDTARNALDNEEFAVNVVTEDLIEEMDGTSASIPPGESEFDHVGIERAPCERIDPPRVARSPVTMECTLFDTLEHHDKLMILGEVVNFHVSEEVMHDGKLEMERLVPVGRLGGPYYTIGDRAAFERQF